MNPDFPKQLAAKLKTNPSLFEDMDASLLGDLLFHYHEGDLDEQDAAKVAAMIQTNPEARAIHQRILDADKYASSENGKAWLESLPDRVLPPVVKKKQTPTSPSFLDQVMSWFAPQAALSFASDVQPIYGKAGLADEVLYTLRPTDDGKTEIGLSTKLEAWSSLKVVFGDEQQELVLEHVGKVWAGSLIFAQRFSAIESLRPIIQNQTV